MAEYEGHRSRNAWNVALWINNDYGLYTTAVEYARKYGIEKGARIFFRNCLKGQRTPDGAKYNLTCVREAMRGII